MKSTFFVICLGFIICKSNAQFIELDPKLLKDNSIHSLIVSTDSTDGCPIEIFKFNSKGYRTYYRLGVTESVQKLYYLNEDSILAYVNGFESDNGSLEWHDSTVYAYGHEGKKSFCVRFEVLGDTLIGFYNSPITNFSNVPPCPGQIQVRNHAIYKKGRLISYELNGLNWPCLVPINETLIVKYCYDERGLVIRIEFVNKQGLLKATWYCLYNTQL